MGQFTSKVSFEPWDTLSLTAIVFVCHFENKIPLTINHGREMSTISGNAVVSLDSRLDLHFSIPARIENKLSRIESRIESCSTENDRFIHH